MESIRSILGFVRFAIGVHLIRYAKFYATIAILIVGFIALLLFTPPPGFPSNTLITVSEDASFRETALALENQHVVWNARLLKGLARLTQSDTDVKAGRYVFDSPVGVGVVLYRLANGISGIDTIRVTFPEGSTVREMSEILSASLPSFDAEIFRAEAKQYEGYLFPDTYLLYADATPEDIISLMRTKFDEVSEELLVESDSPEPLSRIVTMASILEKETKLGEDRAVVSGILWKRIKLDIALQVDAVFGYIHDTDTYHPSLDDLEIDSPYNTYKHRDLPPGPIGNPGKDALYAALHPVASTHLYYLTGNDGLVHYADTFEEHKKNRELYLR